jgi:hypothetical protein
MSLLEAFPAHPREDTSRTIRQLTSGEDFCYPLYYFIPSITADCRYMVYHRESPGTVNEIQLHRLDLVTGESVRLTDGSAEQAQWRPWGVDPARGILGDRSALAPQRGEVVYFDGPRARAADLYSLQHRDLFEVPEDRFVLSQNCVTGDERWFVYVHVDRTAYERLLELRLERDGAFRENAGICRGTAMAAYNLDTGEHRVLFRIDYPVHHVHGYGARSLCFSHIPGDVYGMGFASLDGRGYSIPRPQDEHGGRIIHHVPTAAGTAYELKGRQMAGICDPQTGHRCEFPVLPGTNHTGVDPLGRLFFYQVGGDRIQVMKRYEAGGEHEWLDLFGSWPTHGEGQKAHFHPRLVLGRRWLQMVAGDPRTRTNHIFLIDVSDLDRTENMSRWRADGGAA